MGTGCSKTKSLRVECLPLLAEYGDLYSAVPCVSTALVSSTNFSGLHARCGFSWLMTNPTFFTDIGVPLHNISWTCDLHTWSSFSLPHCNEGKLDDEWYSKFFTKFATGIEAQCLQTAPKFQDVILERLKWSHIPVTSSPSISFFFPSICIFHAEMVDFTWGYFYRTDMLGQILSFIG